MLTPEQETDLRRFVKRHLGGDDRYNVSTLATAQLLAEIDRLRAENASLRSQLHCELCNDTTELEDGRDCPRCKPDLSKALSLGK